MSLIKKIHFCWFGGTKPDAVKRNVEAWGKMNPDYEIFEWNEGNSDICGCPFAERAMEERRWGFVADVVRLKALLAHGGFYADADIEMVKPLACLDEEGNSEKLIMGYMYDCALGTALLYAPPAHPWLKDILESYSRIRSGVFPVNNTIFTAYFINHVQGFLLNGKAWKNDLCRLYPKEVFEQPSLIRSCGVSIHHCCGSWMPENNGAGFGFSSTGGLPHLVKWAKRQVNTWRAARHNEFTACWRAACKGERMLFDETSYFED